MNAKNLLSTNFAMALIVFVAAVLGISDAIAKETMAAIIGLVSLSGLLRKALKSAKFIGWKKFFDPNTVNYLVGVLVVALPAQAVLFEGVMPSIGKLAQAIASKDYGAAASALFSVITFVFYHLRNKKEQAAKAAQ